jgi:hypothetical protein
MNCAGTMNYICPETACPMDYELERTCGSNRLGDAAQEHASNQQTMI